MISPRQLRSALQLGLLGLGLFVYAMTGVFRYSLHSLVDCQECSSYTDSSWALTNQLARAAQVDSSRQEGREENTEAHGQCPICSFLAQAQTAADSSPHLAYCEFLPGERQIDERLAPQLFTSFSLARGPPTV